MKLKASTDRKTANLASPNGKTAKIKNAFGLPAGTEFSCPGATSICDGVCYAGKLERIFKGMRENMLHNWNLVKDASIPELVAMLEEVIIEFERMCDKWNAEKKFRIHHDGDFFSAEYATAWGYVMLNHPEVNFWAYTRSFHVVPYLADIPNFVLYLSVDEDNLTKAIETHSQEPWTKLAALGRTFADARELLVAFGERGVNCPELNGAIPLITEHGGACSVCGLCIFGRNNVVFSSSKK